MSLQANLFSIYNPKLLVSKDCGFNANDICDICKNLCNEATDIGCKNGDIFCKKCLINLCNNDVNKSKQHIKCPSCSLSVNKHGVKINKYAIKTISKYEIYCIHGNYEQQNENNEDDYDEGKVIVTNDENNDYCPWTGPLSDALDHIANECEFARVKCEHCSTSFRRKNMEKHLLDCAMLPIECLLKCGEIIMRSKMNGHVQNECIESFIKCSNDECTAEIPRKHHQTHMLNCEYTIIDCEYRKFGCLDIIFQKNMKQHLNEKQVYHLSLKIDHMQNTIDLLKKKLKQNDDFAIIFENDDNKLSSCISAVNLQKRTRNNYYSFSTDNLWLKNIDASYCTAKVEECSLFDMMDNKGEENVIFRVGGKNEFSPNIAYIVERGFNIKLPDLRIPRYGSYSIFSNIYGLICVGGRSLKGHYPLSSFEVLSADSAETIEKKEKESNEKSMDSLLMNWIICEKQQRMNKSRCAPSCCILGNKLFVCGGINDDYDDKDSKYPTPRSCEVFDSSNKTWSFLSSMNNEYDAAGVCTLDNGSKIAIAVDYHAEIYDSHKNKWISIANMNGQHTSYPLLFTNKNCNDCLMIIGNDGTSKNIKKWGDIEFIDLRCQSKAWTIFSSLPEFLSFDKYDCKNYYFQQIVKLH